MTEKRYVVKTVDGCYYTRNKSGGYWHRNLQTAYVFENISAILSDHNWSTTHGEPGIMEVERVPQPEWREVREL